jgi:hypothetical protein
VNNRRRYKTKTYPYHRAEISLVEFVVLKPSNSIFFVPNDETQRLSFSTDENAYTYINDPCFIYVQNIILWACTLAIIMKVLEDGQFSMPKLMFR